MYHIFVNQKGSSEIWIELSPEYNDIKLIFTNEHILMVLNVLILIVL